MSWVLQSLQLVLAWLAGAHISRRLGRNARFASIGSGLAAAGMGACGYFLSSRSVFLVTLLLTIPTIVSVALIRAEEINPELSARCRRKRR